MPLLSIEKPIDKAQAKQINPVTLAFLGDAVYSLYVREKLVLFHENKTANLQRSSSKIVSAKGQSEFLERVLPLFSEEELEIFKRCRNAKKGTKSKNASVADYNRSTGFEAVIGYLYAIGDTARIGYLLSFIDETLFQGQAQEKAFKP